MNVALICARSGSKGFKDKNLSIFGDQTLIQRSVSQAIDSQIFDKVVFSSDSSNYLDSIKDSKKLIKLKRPDKLSTSSTSKWDVFKHCINEIESKYNCESIEYVADLDVTVPNRTNSHISKSFNILKVNPDSVVITAYHGERSPYFNMIDKSDNKWSVCKKIYKNIIKNRQQSPEILFLSPSVFYFTRKTLFESNHWSEKNIIPNIIPRIEGLDIDSEEDYEILKKLFIG